MCLELSKLPNFNFYLSLEMHQMYFELSDNITPRNTFPNAFIRVMHVLGVRSSSRSYWHVSLYW